MQKLIKILLSDSHTVALAKGTKGMSPANTQRWVNLLVERALGYNREIGDRPPNTSPEDMHETQKTVEQLLGQDRPPNSDRGYVVLQDLNRPTGNGLTIT